MHRTPSAKMPSIPFWDRKKRQQQEQQEEKDRQIGEQLKVQERRIQTLQAQAAEFDRFKRETAEKEAHRQYQANQHQREEQARERARLQYEELKDEQSRLRIEQAQAEEQDRRTEISAENVRKLRELIKTRHHLDNTIWSRRGARKADRDLTLKRMAHSDAILAEIRSVIELWEPQYFNPDEWRVAKRIKDGLLRNEQRVWENNPPWNDR